MMERGKGNKENLPGSLQSLRGEYEEIQRIYWERRIEMPQAQEKMDVRRVSDQASIIDVKDELAAAASARLLWLRLPQDRTMRSKLSESEVEDV